MPLDANRIDYDPNARYDTGPNAAGCGRASTASVLSGGGANRTGLGTDGVLFSAHVRTGFNAAGVSKNNTGPNAAGAPRSANNT